MHPINRTIALVGVILYVTLCIGLVWVFFKPFDAGAMQVVLELLLLPTVIIGFLYATNEFRKSQLRSDLDLHWDFDALIRKDDSSVILDMPRHEHKIYFLKLHLENKGELLTNWFAIEVEVPTFGDYRDIQFDWYIGDSNYWSTEVVPQNGRVKALKHRFSSNGQLALFPGESRHVATLRISVYSPHIAGRNYSTGEELRYSVVTDTSSVVKRSFLITFEPENILRRLPDEYILEDLLVRSIVVSKMNDDDTTN